MAVLTPSAMLELPRPSAALLSPSGLHYAQSSSRYDFRTRRTSKALHAGAVPDRAGSTSSETAGPRVLLQDVRFTEMVWADDDTLLYLQQGQQVDTALSDAEQRKSWAAEKDPELELWAVSISSKKSYRVGSFPAQVSDLKAHHISPTSAVLAFSASVYEPDRSIYKAQEHAKRIAEEQEGSDALVFDKLFVRHWDAWADSSTKQIHVVYLTKSSHAAETGSLHSLNSDEEDAAEQWSFDGKIISPMAGTKLESPVGPFGGSDDFDISATHLVFTAEDPNLPPAWHTRQPIYVLPLRPKSADDARPQCLTNEVGATSSPVFSPTQKQAGQGSVAWLEMREDGYEADRNRVMVHDLSTGRTKGVSEKWDRSPSTIIWSEDARELFLLAEDTARMKLWRLNVGSDEKPTELTNSIGSISNAQVIPTPVTQSTAKESTRLLISAASHISPTQISVIDVDSAGSVKAVSLSALAQPELDKLEPALKSAEEFWFDGAQQKVHGWIMFPPGFNSKDVEKEHGKWPLAFLIHGGPQGSWANSWSTRWNPAVFASQGYITVAIDPTGSTGYGQAFTDAIKEQWGGLPYQDLVAGWQYVLKTYPAIDPKRTAALGGSYGGYSVNWLQGHNPGFKAFVCHDGVFDTEAVWYETEEIYFAERENGGAPPYENPAPYDKWNPKNHVASFATPQLIIHGGKDYRLPDTQGLAMFTALQRRGVPSRMLYFPSENHWVLNPLNSKRWHHEIFKWLEEWL